MRKAAIFTALAGVLLALVTYIASEIGLMDVRTFFKLGFIGLAMMILAAAYFLFSSLREMTRETDFFRRIL
ncbi:hypothetical protein [Chitinophaga defluvii]|uniref:Uncharacterized protein n=1 Tax=Chitinophaga defluvii TaxID=3163343 RepID=A0ABV2TCL6_9BACT